MPPLQSSLLPGGTNKAAGDEFESLLLAGRDKLGDGETRFPGTGGGLSVIHQQASKLPMGLPVPSPPPRQYLPAATKINEERQQAYFIMLFLVGSIASTISNSLESGYISHISPCLDSANFTCTNRSL